VKGLCAAKGLIGAALVLGSTYGHAQEGYPAKTIQMVVPFSPGTGIDQSSRLFARELGQHLQQSVNVENRPGAVGGAGALAASRAKPDGYTVLFGGVTINAANFAFFPGKLGYDAESFELVSGIGSSPVMLWVPSSSPYTDLRSLIADAKRLPGRLSCGYGNAVTHVACEAFKRRAGIFAVNVAYRTGPQALNDLGNNQLSFAFSDPAVARSLVNQAKIKPLAVASRERVPAYKATPSFQELGYSGLEITAWTGIFAPKGTPRDALEKLNLAVKKTVESENSQKIRSAIGSQSMWMNLDDSRKFLSEEILRWKRYVEDTGIKTEP
jgi:tripartite-type tricarboxylate transporter receptor subunit TctC